MKSTLRTRLLQTSLLIGVTAIAAPAMAQTPPAQQTDEAANALVRRRKWSTNRR